jgi:hypothetical protein
MQVSEYLLQVRAGQDRLRSYEMLAGEAGQFGGGSRYQWTPWRRRAVG